MAERQTRWAGILTGDEPQEVDYDGYRRAAVAESLGPVFAGFEGGLQRVALHLIDFEAPPAGLIADDATFGLWDTEKGGEPVCSWPMTAVQRELVINGDSFELKPPPPSAWMSGRSPRG